jgi:hypothetical protein
MYTRSKFVTNSSSTSIIGWGCYLSREEFKKIEELPEGVDYARPPSDDYIVYVELAIPTISEDGVISIRDPYARQEAYLAMVETFKKIGIDYKQIGYIEESWYDG